MPFRVIFGILAIFVVSLFSPSAWATTNYYIEVVLTDADTGGPVSGARVIFSDDRNINMRYGDVTELGSKSGIYPANVPLYDNERQVNYTITITCENYEGRTHYLTTNRGDLPTNRRVSLKLKRVLTRGQWIDVRVMRSDNSQPIVDATVRVGPAYDYSDRSGNVKLHITDPGPGQEHPLSVSHSAFYPFPPKNIPVRMYDDEKQQYYTCCLKPHGVINAPETS